MEPKHDTKFNAAVEDDPGIRVCEAHQKFSEAVFDAMKTYMSRTQTVWTIGVLSAVAIFYGVTLWTTVTARCSESEAKIETIRNQVTVQEVKLKYIEDAVNELKIGQKEVLAELKDLRKEMQRSGVARP